MAGFSSSRSRPSLTLAVALFVLVSFSSPSEAKEILVGGKSGSWAVPSTQQTQSSLTQWAQSTRFLIGDTLVWDYDGDKDSVLEVTKEAFDTCNTTSPIEEHKDGETKVKLSRAGPYYFISRAQGHCEKGQKVEVVVLSPRHHRSHSLAPAPSPSDLLGSPAVAPTSAALAFRPALQTLLFFSALFVLFAFC